MRKCLIRIKEHNLREKLGIIEIVGSSTSHQKIVIHNHIFSTCICEQILICKIIKTDIMKNTNFHKIKYDFKCYGRSHKNSIMCKICLFLRYLFCFVKIQMKANNVKSKFLTRLGIAKV